MPRKSCDHHFKQTKLEFRGRVTLEVVGKMSPSQFPPADMNFTSVKVVCPGCNCNTTIQRHAAAPWMKIIFAEADVQNKRPPVNDKEGDK